MWRPASRNVGGEQERQLMRVHKTTHSGARNQCGFNQGGPLVCLGFLPLCLSHPHKNLGVAMFVGIPCSLRICLMGPRNIIESEFKRDVNNLLSHL